MPDDRRQKIAILGGGIGSLATAYHLTNESEWQDRYEITVYQMGWRLGGKGACGRNADFNERIEEHGPHVWFGFYHVAFQMLNECYEYCRAKGLTLGSPFQQFIPDAMQPKNDSTVMELEGNWKPWHITLPAHPGEPSQPPLGLISQLTNGIEWLISTHECLRPFVGVSTKTVRRASIWTRFLKTAYGFAVKILAPPELRLGSSTECETILGEVKRILEHLHVYLGKRKGLRRSVLSRFAGHLISRLLRSFLRLVDDEVLALIQSNDEVRRAWLLLDLGVANLRGFFEDGIPWNGFESINALDYSDWLRKHGCRNPWSPIVQGLYDTCFAFVKGNATAESTHAASNNRQAKPDSASMEAGTTLRGMLLLFFGYNGSYCYKMQSGMGDTIFTPLYLTLRHRGVKFRFFHQVTNLGVVGKTIESVDVNLQATVRVADGTEYQPLRKVKGLFCWPNQPLFEQLVEGAQLREEGVNLESCWSGWTGTPFTLRRGPDFDLVVLGISLGSFRSICKELIDANRAWKNMIANVATVQTQSFQIWVTKTAEELGWAVDSADPGTAAARQYELMSGYTQPIDSWADMSQVLPTEGWGAALVKSVHYIFGLLSDALEIPQPFTKSDFPNKQSERVKRQMLAFLGTSIAPLWPKGVTAGDPNTLDWALLVDPRGRSGIERADAQFWKANVEPSDRYVLSAKGTGRYRIAPGASGFDNVYLAGDWTKNGFDVGCVEAAALSAKLAAEAIVAAHPASAGAPQGDKTPHA